MALKLKPLNRQVILITGASSGIGRVTARRAAAEGAKVILVARNESALNEAVSEILAAGGQALYAVADVADKRQLRQAAEAGIARFGPIDTWVNNAGVGMYGRIEQIDITDDRRLFDTNFWGVVNGCRLALHYLKWGGGALINVGSEVSEQAIPLQGMYSASKHAVKGFTDALRSEVAQADLPITVTLIKPGSINTPYTRHARNYTSQEPTYPPPVYDPALVADQILFAAENKVRDVYTGGAAAVMVFLGRLFPRLADKLLERSMYSAQLAKRPADYANQGLHETQGGHAERGDAEEDRVIRKRSLYGVASRNPLATKAIALSLATLGTYCLLRSGRTTAGLVRAKLRGRGA